MIGLWLLEPLIHTSSHQAHPSFRKIPTQETWLVWLSRPIGGNQLSVCGCLSHKSRFQPSGSSNPPEDQEPLKKDREVCGWSRSHWLLNNLVFICHLWSLLLKCLGCQIRSRGVSDSINCTVEKRNGPTTRAIFEIKAIIDDVLSHVSRGILTAIEILVLVVIPSLLYSSETCLMMSKKSLEASTLWMGSKASFTG